MKKSLWWLIGGTVLIVAVVILAWPKEEPVVEEQVLITIEKSKVPEETFADFYHPYSGPDPCLLATEPIGAKVSYVQPKENASISVYTGEYYTGRTGGNDWLKIRDNALFASDGYRVAMSTNEFISKHSFRIEKFPERSTLENLMPFLEKYTWDGLEIKLSWGHVLYNGPKDRDKSYLLNVGDPGDIVYITAGAPEKYAINTETGIRTVLTDTGCRKDIEEKIDHTLYLYMHAPDVYNKGSRSERE